MLNRMVVCSCLVSLGALLGACSSDSGSSDTVAAGGAATAGAAGESSGGSGGSGGSAAGQNAGGSAAGQNAGGSAAGQNAGGSAAGAGGDAAGAGGAAAGGMGAFTCPGAAIMPGLNENWVAGGQKRSFYADFPKDTTKPLAVLFWFHGYSDTAKNFRQFGPVPDDYPDMPFVLITPEDTNLLPVGTPQGLDWDIFSAKSGTPNREGDLFEAVLGCLGQGYTVDESRIYVGGFSAGAITTNMLVSRYQDTIAASITFSGAWFNDPAEVKAVNTLGFPVDFAWNDLVPGKGGMLLLTHGGPNDQFGQGGQQIINFENSYQDAVPFLLAAKRPFIDCAHTNGHQPHPGITADIAVAYLKAHQAGKPSPYLGGKLDPMFPSSCTLHEP